MRRHLSPSPLQRKRRARGQLRVGNGEVRILPMHHLLKPPLHLRVGRLEAQLLVCNFFPHFMLIQTVANSGCENWEYWTRGMNSKHQEDIHGHLQTGKCVFFTIRMFPNISEYFGVFPNISDSKNFFYSESVGNPARGPKVGTMNETA